MRQGHYDSIISLAFSPNGRWLASGSRDGTVKIWDVASRSLVTTLDVRIGSDDVDLLDQVERVEFISDDQLVCHSSRGVDLFILRANGNIESMPLSSGEEQFFFSGGPTALMVREDEDSLLVSILRTSDWQIIRTWTAPAEGFHCVAMAPDGRLAVFGYDEQLIAFTMDKGERLWSRDQPDRWSSLVMRFSPDSRQIAFANSYERPQMLDASTGVTTYWLGPDKHRQLGSGSWFQDVLVFSEDGETLVTSGTDGTIHCWSTTTGSHQQELIAQGIYQECLRVDTLQIETRAAAHDEWIRIVAASSLGILASAGDDLLIKLWDLPAGQLMAQLGERRSRIRAITQISSNYVVTQHSDRTVRLHTANFQDLQRVAEHSTGISLGLRPIASDLTIAATVHDGRATIWEIPACRLSLISSFRM